MRCALGLLRELRRDTGQDLIEYALLAAVMGVGCITVILELSRIREFFAAVGLALDSAL